MKRTMGWLCFWLFSIQAGAQEEYRLLENLYRIQNGQIVGRGLFENPSPRFTDLEAQAFRFKRAADVLQYITTQQPKLQKNVVLVHNSESQQVASLEHPRILLFSGGVAYGFSEHPAQKHERIEMMEVDPKTYQLSFNEIIFESTGLRFERNPKSCKTCHGEPGKPLWNPYDFWPHAFASNVGMTSTQEEATAYDQLRARQSASPLLRQLKLPIKMDLGEESNTVFSSFVNQINLGRWINGELPTGKSLKGFERTLLATSSGCAFDVNDRTTAQIEGKLKLLFKSGEISAFPLSFATVLQNQLTGREHFNRFLDRMLEEFFPSPTYTRRNDHDRLVDDARFIAQQIWILSLAGIDTSNLSTSLHGSDVTQNQPTNFSIDLLTALFELRPDLFAGLDVTGINLGLPGQDAWIKVDCNKTRALSVLDSRNVSTTSFESYEKIKNRQPVMSRCSKCHVDHQADRLEPAPSIPFDRPLQFAALLDDPSRQLRKKIAERIRSNNPALQMPPGQPLSKEEIEAFDAYLATF